MTRSLADVSVRGVDYITLEIPRFPDRARQLNSRAVVRGKSPVSGGRQVPRTIGDNLVRLRFIRAVHPLDDFSRGHPRDQKRTGRADLADDLIPHFVGPV